MTLQTREPVIDCELMCKQRKDNKAWGRWPPNLTLFPSHMRIQVKKRICTVGGNQPFVDKLPPQEKDSPSNIVFFPETEQRDIEIKVTQAMRDELM